MSFNQDSRKVQRMTAALARMEFEGAELIRDIARREPAKVIALRSGATPRQAYNWREAECQPRWPHFIALAQHYPDLKAKILAWLGENSEEGTRDDSEKVLHEIQTLLMQRMK